MIITWYSHIWHNNICQIWFLQYNNKSQIWLLHDIVISDSIIYVKYDFYNIIIKSSLNISLIIYFYTDSDKIIKKLKNKIYKINLIINFINKKYYIKIYNVI